MTVRKGRDRMHCKITGDFFYNASMVILLLVIGCNFRS